MNLSSFQARGGLALPHKLSDAPVSQICTSCTSRCPICEGSGGLGMVKPKRKPASKKRPSHAVARDAETQTDLGEQTRECVRQGCGGIVGEMEMSPCSKCESGPYCCEACHLSLCELHQELDRLVGHLRSSSHSSPPP